MNSLSELNSYSSTGVLIANDERPTEFVLSGNIPGIMCRENETFLANAKDITKLININPFSYSINVAAVPNTTVSWEVTESNAGGFFTITKVNDVYTINGIKTLTDWNNVKSPIIDMGINPPDLWTFDSTINYTNNVAAEFSESWTNAVTVTQLDQLTVASDFYYSSDTPSTILYTPQVINLGLDPTNAHILQLVITVDNVNALVSLSSTSNLGGSSFFNPADKSLSITGNLAQVNGHLLNIVYSPVEGNEDYLTLTYTLFNPALNFTTVQSQYLKSQNTIYLSRPAAIYYDKNVPSDISNSLLVNDTVSGTTTYTLTVSGGLDAITNITSNAVGGTATFNDTIKMLTITGTRAQVNTHLANLRFAPGLNYMSDFTLTYILYFDGGVATRTQQVLIAATDTIINNMSISRTFTQNTADQFLFVSDTPTIIEDVPGATYTVQLTSASGNFGLNAGTALAAFTYSGSRKNVNDVFAMIKFYPNKNVYGEQTFSYQQLRNGVASFASPVTVALIGSLRLEPILGIGTFIYTSSTTITPTYEQAYYLNTEILLIGGGAGGGFLQGGGGSGADGVTWSGNLFSATPHSIVIGYGGAGSSGNIAAAAGEATSIKNSQGSTLLQANGGRQGGRNGTPSYTSSYSAGGNGGSSWSRSGSVGIGSTAFGNQKAVFIAAGGGGGGGTNLNGGGGGGNGGATGGTTFSYNGGDGGAGFTSTLLAGQFGRGGGGCGGNNRDVYTHVGGSSNHINGSPGQPSSATAYGDGGAGRGGSASQSFPPAPAQPLCYPNTMSGGQGKSGVAVIKFS